MMMSDCTFQIATFCRLRVLRFLYRFYDTILTCIVGWNAGVEDQGPVGHDLGLSEVPEAGPASESGRSCSTQEVLG